MGLDEKDSLWKSPVSVNYRILQQRVEVEADTFRGILAVFFSRICANMLRHAEVCIANQNNISSIYCKQVVAF